MRRLPAESVLFGTFTIGAIVQRSKRTCLSFGAETITSPNEVFFFFFRAYLEKKELVGVEHNYKYECKQLRATVRYLHRKIDKLQTQIALLGALWDVYIKEDL